MKDGITIFSSGYKGYENKALELRNQNRSNIQTRKHMDWRYSHHQQAPPPKIYWVNDKKKGPVGMASIIFRPYWVDNKVRYIGVLGDISLNGDYRGRGLGIKLFEFMNSSITKELNCPGFVLPNQAAFNGLNKTGWKTRGNFVRHVFLINPCYKIESFITISSLSKVIAKFYKKMQMKRFSVKEKYSIKMVYVDAADSFFDDVEYATCRSKKIMRQKTSYLLNWRYANHPEKKFKIAKYYFDGTSFFGYIIFNINNVKRTCTIYELMVMDESAVLDALVFFIHTMITNEKVFSIQMVINDEHPYSNHLVKKGFTKRKDKQVFQTYNEKSIKGCEDLSWAITSGDKDI